MAQANPFDQFDGAARAVPAAQIKPLISTNEPAPMSPAEATRLGFEGTRLQMQQEAQQRSIDENERQRRQLTETQSKGLGFYQRMRSADVQQARLGLDPQGYAELIAQQRLPLASRAALDDNRRAQLDAIENFVAASLRLESGAAIGPAEFEKQLRIFFPMPGAGPKEIEQKAQQRELAIRGFRAVAGEYGSEQADKNLKELGFLDPDGKPIAPDLTIATAKAQPDTPAGVAMGAVQPGQLTMTPQDMEASKAMQAAWNASGRFDDVARVAAQYGRTFSPKKEAMIRANEGKPIKFVANPTGQPTATEQAVGEFVNSPVGEAVAAGMVGSANAMTLGMLDELAPVLGLDADRVQMAKRYLQERNPGMSLAGEVVGSIAPTGMISRGVGGALAGGRMAGMAPLIGDVTAGALAGAGEANENRMGGALLGGTLGGVGGAVGRRMFGGGPDAGLPPDGGAPMGGNPMGGMGGRASVGAAALPDDVIRVNRAAELPVPVKLANFQKTRAFEQQQRARELAKNNEVGGPIRAKMAEQQKAIADNFDAFLDSTGAEVLGNPGEQGARITAGIKAMADKSKAKYRALYTQAEKAGETREAVGYQPLKDYIASQTATTRERLAPVLKAVEEQLAKNDTVGAGQITLKQAEDIRKLINKTAQPGTPDSVFGGEMKAIIDDITEGAGGDVYKRARAARREHAKLFDEVGIIAQLLGTKRNSTDRVVAAENVVARILAPGTEAAQLRKMRDLVTGEGGDPQAWNEVQGAVMEQIQRAAYPASAVKDEAGNVTVSPAGLKRMVDKLDQSGKLSIIFDGGTAQGLRTLADVAQDVFTAPPGSLNTSNSSSAWFNLFDAVLNYNLVGFPVPAGVISATTGPLKRAIKERPLKKEVQQLIGETQ